MIRWLLNLILGPDDQIKRGEKVQSVTAEVHAETDQARRLRVLTYEWEVRSRRPGGKP